MFLEVYPIFEMLQPMHATRFLPAVRLRYQSIYIPGMKKIIPYFLILGLATVVVIQYFKLRSLSPPEAFEYIIRSDIDLDYHDPRALGAYYDAAHTSGTYAREMWREEGVNVRVPESNNQAESAAAAHFNRLRSNADSLGARLSRSYEWKLKGFNNAEIMQMENSGVSPGALQVKRIFGEAALRKGERNEGVWAIQGMLIDKGYDIPHDGYFWEETTVAVRDFQQKNKLPMTGIAGQATLLKLIQN